MEAFPWQTQALGALALALLLIEGVALSRGARWAFVFGIPWSWKTETLDVSLPEGISGDLTDPLERLHAFDLEDYRSAFWIDAPGVGLLCWAIGSGSRNTFRIRVLRGVGVVASGCTRP